MKPSRILALGGILSALVGTFADGFSLPHALGAASGIMLGANIGALIAGLFVKEG